METRTIKRAIFVVLTVLCSFMSFGTASAELGNESVNIPNQYYTEISFNELEKYEEYKLNLPDTITKYDLLLMNPEIFRKDADSGKMNIQLAGQNFELQLDPGIWISKGDK